MTRGKSNLDPINRRAALLAGVVVEPSGCWAWQGDKIRTGYGVMRVNRAKHYTHRIAYELFVGPIPDGMNLDHLCHTNDPTCREGDDCPHRRCCNPAHLEPVPWEVNIRRGRIHGTEARCPQGHTYDEANTYRDPDGHRHCRECNRIKCRQRRRTAAA